ncbi:MAG: cytidylate kinase family protein [Candidatus Nitrosoabyssus spongiisocia]|nr:MAG: cytidylate kinase family protein [Nitrosopumilaceae archaeon AB1(1)]
MTKSIIVSGPPAVGKTTVALGLAQEFALNYVSGGDILKNLAKEKGFDPTGNDWWDTKPGMEFLKQRTLNSDFDIHVDEQLKKIFDKNNAVLTSYTLPWLVNGGVKIWLEGSHPNSAKRMQVRDNISAENAMEITKTRYDQNKILYKKLYNFDFGMDETIFDIILNTDNLDAKQVLTNIINQVRDML